MKGKGTPDNQGTELTTFTSLFSANAKIKYKVLKLF